MNEKEFIDALTMDQVKILDIALGKYGYIDILTPAPAEGCFRYLFFNTHPTTFMCGRFKFELLRKYEIVIQESYEHDSSSMPTFVLIDAKLYESR